jgi:two-component system, OmpR family, response regulator CpxR
MRPEEGWILVVDDDPSIRETFALVLEMEGHRVRCAADGVEALELLSARPPPKLVLLDLMLPRLSGEQVLETLKGRAELAGLKVVIVSGDSRAKEVARRYGGRDFLVKPVEREELLRHAAEPDGPPPGQAAATT